MDDNCAHLNAYSLTGRTIRLRKKNHFYSLISPLVLLPAHHLSSQALGKGKLKLLLVATFCFKCVLSFKRSLCLENVFGNMLVILKVR